MVARDIGTKSGEIRHWSEFSPVTGVVWLCKLTQCASEWHQSVGRQSQRWLEMVGGMWTRCTMTICTSLFIILPPSPPSPLQPSLYCPFIDSLSFFPTQLWPAYSCSKNCPNVWPFHNVWFITQCWEVELIWKNISYSISYWLSNDPLFIQFR